MKPLANLNYENDFRGDVVCDYRFHMTISWMYDDAFMLIKNGKKEHLLSKREDKFLNLLLHKRGIITYSEMTSALSSNYEDLSQNAIRLFVKDFRKKLPENSLRNIQGVGYKLVL